jgi:hypothetical protein
MRSAGDLIIQPDAIAVIRRDTEGKFHVTTNHHGRRPARPGAAGRPVGDQPDASASSPPCAAMA